MSLRKVEQSDADRPQYLGRYRPCAGVEVAVAKERDARRAGNLLVRHTGVRANRFSVSPSRFGSVVRPYIDDITEANEYVQSAI